MAFTWHLVQTPRNFFDEKSHGKGHEIPPCILAQLKLLLLLEREDDFKFCFSWPSGGLFLDHPLIRAFVDIFFINQPQEMRLKLWQHQEMVLELDLRLFFHVSREK
ncbi:hypothetical protein OIU85_027956 [Salix viminalis]|uniref:Uncharacterized protein n=1 Tax=Salix viminalis TaxID=40686 RepID=A0A9Q0QJE4_SALVM|nr:hypothetical protein OIU85_027956 [Salix viminalis]